MSEFTGRLHIPGVEGSDVAIRVDLDDERIRVESNGVEVGDWALDEVRINAQEDGFHLRAEGDIIVLDISDDARFATSLGLRNAPPILRRRMSALMREET